MSCVLAFREISPQNHLKIVELLSIALGNLDAAATRAKLSGAGGVISIILALARAAALGRRCPRAWGRGRARAQNAYARAAAPLLPSPNSSPLLLPSGGFHQ